MHLLGYNTDVIAVLLGQGKQRRSLLSLEQYCQTRCAGAEQLYLYLEVNSETILPQRSCWSVRPATQQLTS